MESWAMHRKIGFLLAILFTPFFAYSQSQLYAPTNATDYVIRYGDTTGNPISVCQSFTGVSGTPTSLKAYLRAPNGTEGDTLTLGLQESTGGVPDAVWLTYGTIDQDTLTSGFAQYEFTLGSSTTLLAGQEYCVVFETTGAGGSGSPARIDVAGDTVTVSGDLSYYDGSWVPISGTANIEIWGTTGGGSGTSSATSTELTSIANSFIWLLWLIAFICGHVFFERYYRT